MMMRELCVRWPECPFPGFRVVPTRATLRWWPRIVGRGYPEEEWLALDAKGDGSALPPLNGWPELQNSRTARPCVLPC